jgi:hypothetical protein
MVERETSKKLASSSLVPAQQADPACEIGIVWPIEGGTSALVHADAPAMAVGE